MDLYGNLQNPIITDIFFSPLSFFYLIVGFFFLFRFFLFLLLLLLEAKIFVFEICRRIGVSGAELSTEDRVVGL